MEKRMIKTLIDLMSSDKNIICLIDHKTSVLGKHRIASNPKQCLDVGIAEQNAIGIATGLSLEERKVFILGCLSWLDRFPIVCLC